MSKWATIDIDKLVSEVEKLDAQVIALAGVPPAKVGRVKFEMETAVAVARLMGTRDALVIVANCTIA